MLSGNITGAGWMKRSVLWNIVALQNPDGSWNATDSLAGALRAAEPPELSPPIDKVNANPIIKSYYTAEEMLRECPPRLRECAQRMGHNTIDAHLVFASGHGRVQTGWLELGVEPVG